MNLEMPKRQRRGDRMNILWNNYTPLCCISIIFNRITRATKEPYLRQEGLEIMI